MRSCRGTGTRSRATNGVVDTCLHSGIIVPGPYTRSRDLSSFCRVFGISQSTDCHFMQDWQQEKTVHRLGILQETKSVRWLYLPGNRAISVFLQVETWRTETTTVSDRKRINEGSDHFPRSSTVRFLPSVYMPPCFDTRGSRAFTHHCHLLHMLSLEHGSSFLQPTNLRPYRWNGTQMRGLSTYSHE
jgi:hypothetical protein